MIENRGSSIADQGERKSLPIVPGSPEQDGDEPLKGWANEKIHSKRFTPPSPRALPTDRLQQTDSGGRNTIMARTTTSLLLLGLLSLTAPSKPAAAGEPAPETWRHPALKATAGLQLWLDAGRQNAARAALHRPQLRHGDKVDAWYDASGNGRHLLQKDGPAQPSFHDTTGVVAIRFDGDETYLVLRDLKQTYREMTIFLVATPFANPGDFRAFLAMNRADKNDYSSG